MAFQLIDPGSKIDFTCDFSSLLDTGVTITGTPTWTIFPIGPTIGNQTNTTTVATIFVSLATLGVVYRLTCQIVTNATTAQTFERSIVIRCENR